MKTKEQIEKEIGFGDCFTVDEFAEYVTKGYFNRYDGVGYFHDGENETRISVWADVDTVFEARDTYPYVMWYNK